eukprot:2136570-Pyramimonas_sp.AAC.2
MRGPPSLAARLQLAGGRHVARGRVAPGMHLASEFAERCLTGRAPRGPVVLASSPPRICPTARPIATH